MLLKNYPGTRAATMRKRMTMRMKIEKIPSKEAKTATVVELEAVTAAAGGSATLPICGVTDTKSTSTICGGVTDTKSTSTICGGVTLTTSLTVVSPEI